VPIRLRTMLAGTVIGEMGLYTGEARSASVVAGEDLTALRLGKESLHRMEIEAPSLALEFHRAMATRLAQRMRRADHTIEAMMA